ncbi:MAG TPA: DinB family protein [Bryobacteraceae bacterium]|nr:DinB family protein [Bryobacteraceae bacterium]
MSILASYRTSFAISMLLVSAALAWGQPPQSPAKQINSTFAYVNKNILDMAQDFPADKYDFRLKPEMRSFGEVIVHVTSGVVYAAKKGRGENVQWDELDAKNYETKAAIVALLQKSITDANATLKAVPEDSFAKNLNPWLSVIEHSGEHYGLLVAYYRANGLVPPASRPQPKK